MIARAFLIFAKISEMQKRFHLATLNSKRCSKRQKLLLLRFSDVVRVETVSPNQRITLRCIQVGLDHLLD